MSEKSSNREMSWERQPGEPDKWYQRFLLYRNQAPTNRTIMAAIRTVRAEKAMPHKKGMPISGNPSAVWNKMAKRWDWIGRARRYDDHLQKEIEESELKWRIEMRAKEKAVAGKLLQQAERMLDVPIVRQETIQRDDGTTIILRPTKRWGKDTATAMAATASRLIDGIVQKDEKKKVEESEKNHVPQADIDWLREIDPKAASES
jgi:hypothetical protein